MPYSKDSFVTPPLLTVDGMTQIAPRTRLAHGHLVYIRYERRSSNELVNMPRYSGGTYAFAKVVGVHAEDSSLLHVTIVAYAWNNTATQRSVCDRYIVPKRCCTLLHPDPAWYATDGQACPNVLLPEALNGSGLTHTTLSSVLASCYVNANRAFRAKAKNHLLEKMAHWDNLRKPTSREAMITRCLAGFYNDQRRSSTGKDRLNTWFDGRKRRGKELSLVISRLRKDPTPDNFRLMKRTVDNLTSNGNLHQSSADRLRSIGTALMNQYNYFYYGRCGHWHRHGHVVGYSGDVSALVDPNNYALCIDCFMQELANDRIVEALTTDGNTSFIASISYNSLYEWSDGSWRTGSEPPIIGGYHSSKEYLDRPLPHLNGKEAKDFWPYIGYELEFVRNEDCSKTSEWIAKRMQGKMLTAVESAALGRQRYACFERDASVEFELVSGFGPLDIHRAAILGILSDGDAAKYVRSHDGGRCGLHVHVDKPKSLTHAIRMTQFYHDEANRRLLKTVARRYSAGSGYAKAVPGKGGGKLLASVWKAAKRDYYDASNNRERRKARAMSLINSDRYELVNWQNPNTAEIRAFRGSLRAETVIACLEFAYLAWHFTKDNPSSRLTEAEFLKFISSQSWRSESSYLRAYLSGKGFDVWMPKPNPMTPRPLLNEDLVSEI